MSLRPSRRNNAAISYAEWPGWAACALFDGLLLIEHMSFHAYIGNLDLKFKNTKDRRAFADMRASLAITQNKLDVQYVFACKR